MINFEAIVKNNPQFVKEVLAHNEFDFNLKLAINNNHKTHAWYNDKHSADKDSMNFLNAEYVAPVLDNIEKKYLSDVIRPFKCNVKNIRKSRCNDKYFIEINMVYNYNRVCLPYFSTNSGMYKGMELNIPYTLKELGL